MAHNVGEWLLQLGPGQPAAGRGLALPAQPFGAQPVARGLNLRPLQLFRIADEAPRRGANRRALDDDRLVGCWLRTAVRPCLQR